MKKIYNITLNIILIIAITLITFINNTYTSFAKQYTADELIDMYCTKKGQDINHPHFSTKLSKVCQCGNNGDYGKASIYDKNPHKNDNEAVLYTVHGDGTVRNSTQVYYPSCKEWQDNIVAAKGTDKKFSPKVMEKVEADNVGQAPTVSYQEDSFKPIDISGMTAKTPTEEQKAAAEVIQITAEGQGGNDTSSHGLSDIAVFNRSNDAIGNLFNLVKKWSNIFLGLAIVFGLASTVVLFVQLGVYSSNPRARASIMSKLTIVFIATILCTFVSVLFNFFMNIFLNR